MLFIIDMQNDYIDKEKGRSPVPNSDKIVPKIIQEIKKEEEQGEPIYYTLDQHNSEGDRSPEERKWGLDLYSPLKKILKKHTAIKKQFHSISPEDAEKLRNEYHDIPDRVIKVVGVETNVCVISNAIMLHNSFPLASIYILEDLCIGTTADLHEDALNVMKSLKMEIKYSTEK